MKRMKIKRWFSFVIITCLFITSTPLQAIAAEIDESRQWQEIITTFEGDQSKNSLKAGNITPEAINKDKQETPTDEIQFSLEAANGEFKTDRFIVKYKDDVELKNIIKIPDLKDNAQGKKILEKVSDSMEQNDASEESKIGKQKPENLDELQEFIPVEIDIAQLKLSQTPIDTAAVVESENMMVFDTKKEMTGSELADALKTQKIGKDIQYIQPDYEVGIAALDPYLDDQWGHYQMYDPSAVKEDSALMQLGKDTFKFPYRLDANVQEAWEKTKGKDKRKRLYRCTS